MNHSIPLPLPVLGRKPFRHYLPRLHPPATPSSSATINGLIPSPDSARASWRILVIDDDPGIRHVMGELLSRTGHRVATADNGESGWKALSRETFDVVVTDHDMPRLTGLELLRRMRAQAMRLPVVLASGCTPWEAPDLHELLEPGKVLEKPFSFAELIDTLGSLLTAKPRPSPSPSI